MKRAAAPWERTERALCPFIIIFPGYDKELAAGEPSAFKGRTLHVGILLLFKELRL